MISQWNTALVTGASSGIGEQFCRLLAAEGANLVIVARDQRRLDALAGELTLAYGIDVEVLPADLTDTSDLARVASRLAKTHNRVDLLVNNAGLAFTGNFVDLPLAKHQEQLAVNVSALVELAHSAASSMSLAEGGTILNVSSIAGDLAGPQVCDLQRNEVIRNQLQPVVVHRTGRYRCSGLLLMPWVNPNRIPRPGWLRCVRHS